MDIYKQNIEALRKTHPHLVTILERTSVDKEKIIISHSLSGELQVCYRKTREEKIVINDSDDLSMLPKKAAELLEQQDVVILLLGFGLGGYPEALHARLKTNAVLIVYEADPVFFKAVLQERDFSSILASDSLKIILGDEIDFGFIDTYHRKILQGNSYVLSQSGFVNLNKSAYETFRTRVAEIKKLKDTSVYTGISRGAEWTDAFIRNIPIILRTPGVKRLKNLFHQRPAIIISAGPSIEKNLHLLKEAKGKAILVAVDVVVPTLLPAGIMPDFIIALEANRKLFRAFENNPLLRFCPLIIAAEVDYETITSRYPGPVFLNPAIRHPVMKWLHKFWEDKGFIAAQGGSVSHMAFAVAEYLGARVIALMGQDLSFREKLHAGDVTRFFYSENDVENYRQRNPVVKDIFGEERYTTGQFLTFRTSFERLAKKFTGVVINVTEGGLPIDGIPVMRLKDFLEEYCRIRPINIYDTVVPLGEMKTDYELKGLITHICDGLSRFTFIRTNANEIVECVLALKEMKEKNMLHKRKAVTLIKKIEERENIVEDPLLAVIAPYRSSIKNYLRCEKDDDNSFDAIQDSLDYYRELIRVIEETEMRLNTLVKALENELEVDDILNGETIPSMDRYYQAGLIHAKAGMVREAVKNLEQAAGEFSKIIDPDVQKKRWEQALAIHWMLAELYIKQQRFYESKEILRVLVDLAPEDCDKDDRRRFSKQSVVHLLDICDTGIACWETQQINTKKILDKANQEYGSHLESGIFYFRAGDYERAKVSYKKAIEENTELLGKDKVFKNEDSIEKARLVGSFFGLAQTYVMLNDFDKAVQTLDMGLPYALEMDKITGCHGSEFGKLFKELYDQCGRGNKAQSLQRRASTV